MSRAEESVRTAKLRMEAYARARPLVEQFRDEPLVIECMVEAAWELLSAHGRYSEITTLVQDGLNYLLLGFQKMEVNAVEESAAIDEPRLIVTWNETARTAACGVCGNPDTPLRAGPELFLEGQTDPVCERCASKYAPEMVGLMKIFHKNAAFTAALQNLRDEAGQEAPSSNTGGKQDTELKLRRISDKFNSF